MLARSGSRRRGPRARLVVLAALTVLAAVAVAPVAAQAAYRQSYAYKDHIDTSVLNDPAFQPCGMAVDASGDIFVAGGADYVAEFAHNATGTPAATIGADMPDIFGDQVVDVALYGTDLWLCGADGAAQFTTSGAFTASTITSVAGSPFDDATAIAVDAAGNVFIADTAPVHNDYERITKFSANGSFVCTFTYTSGDDAIYDCDGLTVDAHDNVWAADSEDGLWVMFRPNATKTAYAEHEMSDYYQYDGGPLDIAFGSDSSMFLACDTDDGGLVYKLDSSGNKLAAIGTPDDTTTPIAGELSYPLGIVLSGNDVWVADHDTGWLSDFTLRNNPPTTKAYANVTVKKGKSVTFKYMASDDLTNSLPVTIRVFKGTTLEAAIACGTVSQGVWHTKSWTCKLAKGTYTWKVYATDGQGQPVTPGTEGHKTLTVK